MANIKLGNDTLTGVDTIKVTNADDETQKIDYKESNLATLTFDPGGEGTFGIMTTNGYGAINWTNQYGVFLESSPSHQIPIPQIVYASYGAGGYFRGNITKIGTTKFYVVDGDIQYFGGGFE